ncbi:hypothetical protein JOQ06_006611 [Pogonophryne albipinna]|uniref:Uncharacterized protein n=1 Tax=Pogonophryne albipinna TaxID=1090488 RepID=A0AAD6B000_9TELE|nr:hypothetical protein JOQ06_006611 [Pogonophryne albipinna]
MDNRYILEQTSVGTRVGGADFNYRPGRSVLCDTRVPTAEKNGPMPVYTHGPVFYKLLMDGGSVSGVKGERTSPKGNGRILHEVEKTGLGEQKDTGSSGILKRASPTHCPGTNGQSPGVFMHLDIRNPGKQAELANNFRAAQEWIIPPSEIQPLPSSHIPVPRNSLTGPVGAKPQAESRYESPLDIWLHGSKQSRVPLEQHRFAFAKHRKPSEGLLWLVLAEGQISRADERGSGK